MGSLPGHGNRDDDGIDRSVHACELSVVDGNKPKDEPSRDMQGL